MFTGSPVANVESRCSSATTSPDSMPTRASRSSVRTLSSVARPARTARSASSSCASGIPKAAMTASPANFSTVPPCVTMQCATSSKKRETRRRTISGSTPESSSVESTRSTKSTVASFRSIPHMVRGGRLARIGADARSEGLQGVRRAGHLPGGDRRRGRPCDRPCVRRAVRAEADRRRPRHAALEPGDGRRRDPRRRRGRRRRPRPRDDRDGDALFRRRRARPRRRLHRHRLAQPEGVHRDEDRPPRRAARRRRLGAPRRARPGARGAEAPGRARPGR